MKHTFLPAIFTLALALDVSAQHPGDLDSTFGVGGIVTTILGVGYDEALSSAIQPDGKIIAAGFTFNGDADSFAVARYNTDGSLDTSFGGDGIQTIIIDSSWSDANSVAVSNGKIIAAGNDYTVGALLVRYNDDGTLDSSFSSDGIVTDSTFGVSDMVVQADGKIVMGGTPYFTFVRFNVDGSLDSNFSEDGKSTYYFNVPDPNKRADAIALQPDGKIVATGINHVSINYEDFMLTRVNSDGSLDTTFGNGGWLFISFGSNDCAPFSLVVQPDGKIIVVGTTLSPTGWDFAMARVNPDGTLDNGFGSNGKVITKIDTMEAGALAVVIQSDGKIIVGGTSGEDYDVSFTLIRYNSDGTLDNSFGTNGIIITDIGLASTLYSLNIQQDGRIIAAGSFIGISANGTYHAFALARYLSDLNVGIIEFSESPNNILIYPNPLTQTATLEYTLQQEETLSIRLLDLQGKTIKTFLENTKREAGSHQQAITLPESLPSGSYLIVIESAKGKMGVKVVK